MLATVKVIPFAAPRSVIDAWTAAAHGALRVAPLVPQRVGLIQSRLDVSVASLLRDRGPGEASTPEISYERLQSVSVEQPTPVTGSVRLRIDVSPRIW